MVEQPALTTNPPDVAAMVDHLARIAASLQALQARVAAEAPTPAPPAHAGQPRSVRGTRAGAHVDPVQLLALVDAANKQYLDLWSAYRGDLSLAVARQMLAQWDLAYAWTRRWGSWCAAAQRCLQAALDGSPGSGRGGRGKGYATVLPLALHLRYAGHQSFGAIAKLLGIAAATVQGYVTSFEEEVARTVALETLKGRLPSPWRLLESGAPARALALTRPPDQGEPSLVGVEVAVASGVRIRREDPLRPTESVRARRHDDPPRLWVVAFYDRMRVGFLAEPSSWQGMDVLPIDRLLSYAHRAGFDAPEQAIEDLCRGEEHARRAERFFRA